MNPHDPIILNKLTSLAKSKFRSKFKLTQKDRDYIVAKGIETVKAHAFQFVNSRIAPDFNLNKKERFEKLDRFPILRFF
jgi:hypothetical protein